MIRKRLRALYLEDLDYALKEDLKSRRITLNPYNPVQEESRNAKSVPEEHRYQASGVFNHSIQGVHDRIEAERAVTREVPEALVTDQGSSLKNAAANLQAAGFCNDNSSELSSAATQTGAVLSVTKNQSKQLHLASKGVIAANGYSFQGMNLELLRTSEEFIRRFFDDHFSKSGNGNTSSMTLATPRHLLIAVTQILSHARWGVSYRRGLLKENWKMPRR